MATFILLAVDSYARPGQMMRLHSDMIFRPSETNQYWTLSLDPETRGIPSKTGEYDTTIALDAKHYESLTPILERLAELPSDRPLWSFTYPELVGRFYTACAKVGVQLVVYQARHSGASIDATLRRRSLADIQKRGGWRSTKSTNRYEKGGRLAQVWTGLSHSQRAHCLRREENLTTALVHGRAV